MPVRGLNQFTRDLSAFSAGIEEEVNKVKRDAALRVLTGVTLATPVDTGRARGNWTASIGAPDRSVSESRGKSGRAPNATGSAVASP
ncbi:MAG: HK97 gp10 family phage protein, partial [bacterium]|nr:HK97 gp10 family phage protein [bacterium]